MKTKTKDKDLELIKDLQYQVYFGAYNWQTADKLMLKAVSTIRKLRKELKKQRGDNHASN